MIKITLWKDKIFWMALLSVVPFYLFLVSFAKIPVNFKPELFWSSSFLLLSFLFPFLEEIVFRGFLQEKISTSSMFKLKKLWQLSYANIFTSLIFCALHFIYHSPLWAFSVFFPSLVFGFFKERYQALYVPIILHIFYNASYFILFGID